VHFDLPERMPVKVITNDVAGRSIDTRRAGPLFGGVADRCPPAD